MFIDVRRPFGIAACPECDRLIWWMIRSENGARLFLSLDFKHQLLNDPGTDFLNLVELVMKLEEEFDVEIPDADAETFESVEDIVRYMEKHRKKGKRPRLG